MSDPFTPIPAKKLREGLEGIGWTREGDILMSPGKTMWLNADAPWAGSLEEFRERMEGRAARIRGFLTSASSHEDVGDAESALHDVAGLLDVIARL
jgi:hypothetical protein